MQMFVVNTFREIKIRTKMAPPAPQLWGEKHPWLAPSHKCQLKVPHSEASRRVVGGLGGVCVSPLVLACIVDPIEPKILGMESRSFVSILGLDIACTLPWMVRRWCSYYAETPKAARLAKIGI
jgi:hypothetical protein